MSTVADRVCLPLGSFQTPKSRESEVRLLCRIYRADIDATMVALALAEEKLSDLSLKLIFDCSEGTVRPCAIESKKLNKKTLLMGSTSVQRPILQRPTSSELQFAFRTGLDFRSYFSVSDAVAVYACFDDILGGGVPKTVPGSAFVSFIRRNLSCPLPSDDAELFTKVFSASCDKGVLFRAFYSGFQFCSGLKVSLPSISVEYDDPFSRFASWEDFASWLRKETDLAADFSLFPGDMNLLSGDIPRGVHPFVVKLNSGAQHHGTLEQT